jgi:polyhydroxyalkanoic acid synthase PhaR subunit
VADEAKDRPAASSPTGEKQRPDPYGLYRRWFGLSEDTHNTANEGTINRAEIRKLWRRWFETMVPHLNGAAESKSGFPDSVASLWAEMAEDVSAKMLSEESLPENPLRFFLQWYNDTEERWSEAADEILRNDEVLEKVVSDFETSTRSYQELRHASEEGLKKLQAPTRSDVARVAKLVVVVENKVDRIEEAFEEFVYGDSELATAGAVGSIEERMDQLEGKMDRIIDALERIGTGEEPGSGTSPGAATEKDRHAAGEPDTAHNEASSIGANAPGYS